MTKSPDAFRTISEVAEALDVPAHVLRFWETRFTQVKPVKRGGGRRYYRPDDVRLLRGIRGLLYDDGMTIKGVQKILRERGVRHVIGLGTVGEAGPAAAAALARARPAKTSARPTAERAVARRNGGQASAPAAAWEPDLFALRGETVQAVGAAKPLDREALRQLVVQLEALRREMVRPVHGVPG
jgi:DNA-binding transcriptional MerR regulator